MSTFTFALSTIKFVMRWTFSVTFASAAVRVQLEVWQTLTLADTFTFVVIQCKVIITVEIAYTFT